MDQVFQPAADQGTKPLRRAKRINIGAEVEDPPGLYRRFAKYLVDVAAMFKGVHKSLQGLLLKKQGSCQCDSRSRLGQLTNRAEGIAGRSTQEFFTPSTKNHRGRKHRN